MKVIAKIVELNTVVIHTVVIFQVTGTSLNVSSLRSHSFRTKNARHLQIFDSSCIRRSRHRRNEARRRLWKLMANIWIAGIKAFQKKEIGNAYYFFEQQRVSFISLSFKRGFFTTPTSLKNIVFRASHSLIRSAIPLFSKAELFFQRPLVSSPVQRLLFESHPLPKMEYHPKKSFSL